MTTALDLLPTRRVEAWKYSDLRAALAESEPHLRAEEGAIIARLAPSAPFELNVAAGETENLVERFDRPGLDARAVVINLAPGASLTRVVIQTGSDVPLSHARVRLEAGATFRQIIVAEGARLARIETDVEVAGEDATVTLSGLYLAAAGRHADLTSTVTHAAQRGTTKQVVRGVARKGGRGVFQGKIVVAPGAQKTDARQHHQALLLEEGAEVFAKPELLIHADDVSCAHGNTIGALDEEALFYLRSRGLPESEARALLISAFLESVIPDDLAPPLANEIRDRIRLWLESAR